MLLKITILFTDPLITASINKSLYYENKADISDNFIIRWGFQAFCDHIYDPRNCAFPTLTYGCIDFQPSDVKAGDIIFVRRIDEFMEEFHPFITKPYMIITHGQQEETNKAHHRRYLDEKNIIAWFSVHPFKDPHPKFHPLPLGIQPVPDRYKDRKTINARFKFLRENSRKKNLLYGNFDPNTHGSRKKLYHDFKDKPYCFMRSYGINFDDYLQEMAESKFVLSPRGVGPDSYRTWEALLVGSIPIVLRGMYEHADVFDNEPRCSHTQLDELYRHLPILIINDWSEISEEFLSKQYEIMSTQQYDMSSLYLDYWKNKILDVRNGFMRTYHENTI